MFPNRPNAHLRYLTCNPFCRRICCDVDPDKSLRSKPDDDEGVEQVETDSWNNEQVHGGNVWRVVVQEGSPSLAGRPRRLTMYLATLDCATSNPSLSSSPWIRGAPQSGFSTLIRRINTRSSVSICGRPPSGRDFQRQYPQSLEATSSTSRRHAGHRTHWSSMTHVNSLRRVEDEI
jgi:hypothetical protein